MTTTLQRTKAFKQIEIWTLAINDASENSNLSVNKHKKESSIKIKMSWLKTLTLAVDRWAVTFGTARWRLGVN